MGLLFWCHRSKWLISENIQHYLCGSWSFCFYSFDDSWFMMLFGFCSDDAAGFLLLMKSWEFLITILSHQRRVIFFLFLFLTHSLSLSLSLSRPSLAKLPTLSNFHTLAISLSYSHTLTFARTHSLALAHSYISSFSMLSHVWLSLSLSLLSPALCPHDLKYLAYFRSQAHTPRISFSRPQLTYDKGA